MSIFDFTVEQCYFLLLTYFIGTIPSGLIVGKVFGVGDIRQVGSGNIGATNMVRVGGKKLGLITLVLDACKSILPIVFVPKGDPLEFYYLTGLIATLGHCFPIWLKFRGGKGVATGLGVIAAAHLSIDASLWWQLGIFFTIWVGIYLGTKIVSLASLCTFLLFPLVTSVNFNIWITPLLLTIIIIMRHRSNIERLLKGKEHVFSNKS